jgi:predicted naringenin-chalcone synthase
MIISDFQILRPPYETLQEDTLDWLADAHAESEKTKTKADQSVFRQAIFEKLWQIGCKPTYIAKRGHIIKDYLHKNWDAMEIYRLKEHPNGLDLSTRSEHFERHVDAVFERYYPDGCLPPNDLIHVSCTGYIAPSGAQKIVSLKNWGDQTTVTHAYHMGCYAAIPAIRIAEGFLSQYPDKEIADIVHTEICSLHTNPSNHNPDQLVSQSLFADGFIKYSIKKRESKPHIKSLGVLEEIIPNSIKSMTWNVVQWGSSIMLGKEVPILIARALPLFLQKLAKKGNVTFSQLTEKAIFAVHPGGPKILLHIQDMLKLKDDQMRFSFDILKNYGNMSSATLPHIWSAILNDGAIPSGSLIVSLAFGPGLSITGAIMEKRCG